MKLIVIATTVLHLAWGAAIVDVNCPDSCTCQINDQHLETSCVSYEFIKKLLPKQQVKIVRLNINNASLVSVDLKLKYLKNLHSLDLSINTITSLPSQFPYLPKLKSLNLSHNHLNNVDFSPLPKNLQTIDLSYNSITKFPKDWSNLKQLKQVHFHGNPIDCDCDNLSVYEQMLKGGIVIPSTLTCHYPKEYYGQPLNTMNCTLLKENLLNAMLGEEPGSGADSETQEDFNVSLADEDELMNAQGVTTIPEKEEDEEGSGYEGSGELIPILPIEEKPKACHFNCSTPRPIGTEDEKNASPLPSVPEQAQIILEDIIQPEKVNTLASPVKEVDKLDIPETTIAIETSVKKEVEEVETFPTNDTVIGEMERASLNNSNNQSVYIVVGLLIAFATFLLIYFLNKKRNQKRRANRKRNKSNENGFGEEMKPLGKSAEPVKPVEQITSKVPNNETAPLLNGQNGKITNDDNTLKPPAEDELENVELRKPDKLESLTPQPERVTIKAGELPDSVPKTPMLVHRQLNSDGGYVTTAINSN